MYLHHFCPEPIQRSIDATYDEMREARKQKAQNARSVVSCAKCGKFCSIHEAHMEHNHERDIDEYLCPRCEPLIPSAYVIKSMEAYYGIR